MSGVDHDDGFQRVLTASERRILRKNAGAAAGKSITLSEANSLENSVASRLKKLGIDVKKELHEITVDKVDQKELLGIIDELDTAIHAVGNGVVKPDQHLSVAELDSKIKATKANLSQLKSKTRGAALSKEELDKASHETETYISYLQEQIGITREFLKVKTSQASLLKLKNICRHVLSIKPKSEAPSTPVTTSAKFSKHSKRDPTYIYGILKPVKEAKRERLDVSDLVSEDVSIAIDAKRFQHPFNYILRIRSMFDTFIDRSEPVKGAPTIFTVYGLPADVKACIKHLQTLDMGPQPKVALSFSKYKQLPNIEEKFDVLSFHYAGELDVLGTRENVKAAFAFVNDFLGAEKATPAPTTENVVPYDYLVSRALSSKFRPLVRNIEVETGVSVHFEVNSKTLTGKATFQSKSGESVEECIKAVSLLASDFGHREIFNASPEAVAFITDSEVQRKRYKSPNTCILKQGDRAFVVGFKKNLELGYNRAVALAESRTTEPHLFKLGASQVSVIAPYLGAIENDVGSHLQVHSAKRDDAHVEIFGNSAQQKESVARLKALLDNHVSLDRSLSPVQHTVLSEDRSKLEELETNFRVKLTLGKQSLKITGEKPNLKNVQGYLDTTFSKVFDVSLDGVVDEGGDDGKHYGHLKVEQKFLGKIIGKNGSTMRDIVARSGLSNILVCRDAGGDSFLLVGSKPTIATAVQVIKHVVESDADLVDVSKMDLNRSIEEEYTSKHSFIRRTASIKPKQEKKTKEVLGNIDDTNDFPAL